MVREDVNDAAKYMPLTKQVALQQEWFAKAGREAKRLCTATKDVKDKDKAKEKKTEKKTTA